MTTATPSSVLTTRAVLGVGTALRTGLAAGLVTGVLNVAVSAVVRHAGARDDFAPLTPGPVVLWTALGTVLGPSAGGWP